MKTDPRKCRVEEEADIYIVHNTGEDVLDIIAGCHGIRFLKLSDACRLYRMYLCPPFEGDLIPGVELYPQEDCFGNCMFVISGGGWKALIAEDSGFWDDLGKVLRSEGMI